MFKLTLFVLVSCSLILKAHGVTYRQIEADISNLFLVNQYSGNIYNTYNAKCVTTQQSRTGNWCLRLPLKYVKNSALQALLVHARQTDRFSVPKQGSARDTKACIYHSEQSYLLLPRKSDEFSCRFCLAVSVIHVHFHLSLFSFRGSLVSDSSRYIRFHS